MEIKRYQNYIGSNWKDSSNAMVVQIKSPCDGSVVSEIADSNIDDVNEAVAEAKRAFYEEDWAFNPRLRATVLSKWAIKMRDNFDMLVGRLSLESGKPLIEASIEIKNAIGYMEYSSASARTLYGTNTSVNENSMNIMVREPVGVVVGIEPWNYPITLMVRDSIPALAAGNSLIIKPATQTSGVSMEVIKLLNEIPELPKGICNAITGPGHIVGPAFSEHPDVDMVTMTGGLDTGKDIMRRAAGTMKKVSLELGGKSANVVFADCDWQKALTFCSQAIFSNAGQTCTAASRLVIDEKIADKFLAELVEIAENIQPGYCLDPETTMGPVSSESQMNKILTYIEEAEEYSECLTGGHRYLENGCDQGYFIAPTIFLNPPVNSPIVQEEIFGPVLVVQTFKTEEKAVELANCTRYGLASGVWSQDLNTVMRVSRKLRSGNVWVNSYNRFFPECETGGYKESGSERASGVDGFLKYTEIKNIAMDYS